MPIRLPRTPPPIQELLERKASEMGVLLRHARRHSGFLYTVLSHQNSHGVSHQTARSDLQKLAVR